jgi:predicted ATPase/DNA-binding SARP family transcriptional activator
VHWDSAHPGNSSRQPVPARVPSHTVLFRYIEIVQPRLEIRLLGPVEASAGGAPVALGGARQRSLLAVLAVAARPVPADRLAEELWQGDPPPGAESTLRSYVSRLRRALGADAVVARGGGYALAAGDEAIDAQRFERLVESGREELGRGAAGLAAERLRAALALWRGNALAGTTDCPELAAEARRLEELRLGCIESRVEADLALGRHDVLVPELRALVESEPLRERFHAQLALALYRSGRQAEALDALRAARTLLDRRLGLEPGEELRRLEREILRQDVPAVAPGAARHNLPSPATSFVGRGEELAQLEELLRAHRLVTLSGIGGCGKTRLALEAARRQAGAWRDGVWLVDLAALTGDELVGRAVADALGVDAAAGPDAESVVAHARTRELLVLLDNCEHVLEGCAQLTATLLRECPNVRILATSRTALALSGEVDYALDPLPPHEAVRLFLDRAAAARRQLAADDATVDRICSELDGLPLAIELAAARVKALSPAEIAARLDDRFRFLRAWQRVANPRHRTLQTTMDWSYDLLAPAEQQLLRRLSVFAGGIGLEAVAEVCLDGDGDAALDLLARLVDASLVRVEGGERTRYRLLETVRQYAAAKLVDESDADDVRRRHAHHYFRVAESAHIALEAVGQAPQNHEPVLREQHNLRAAIEWATDADVELALRLMLQLENFWVTIAPLEGRRRFERLLENEHEVGLVLRARMWRDYASCLDVLLVVDEARRAYTRSRELFVEAGDEVAAAHLDFRLGIVARHVGDNELARRMFTTALETCRQHGDAVGELQILGSLGTLAFEAGDFERALELVATSIRMAEALGWNWWVAQRLLQLAEVSLELGDPDDAEARARRALPLVQGIGSRQYVLYALAVLARAAALRGDDERALALWASVDAVEDAPGRFGRFDRSAYAAAMPPGPRPQPAPLERAVELALIG